MLIKANPGIFVRVADGSSGSISAGDIVGLSAGNAVVADKDTGVEAYGIAKRIDGATIIVQTEGKYPNSDSGNSFWLSTSGALQNSLPTTGIIQQVATRISSQEILITIDRTVIVL